MMRMPGMICVGAVVASLPYPAHGLAHTLRKREVRVTVVAQTEQGQPIDRLMFHTTTPANDPATYVTDADGRRTVLLSVPESVSTIVFTLGYGAQRTGLSHEVQ